MNKELPKVYEPQQVESRIYQMWEEHRSLRETGAGTAIYQSDFKEKESFPTD